MKGEDDIVQKKILHFLSIYNTPSYLIITCISLYWILFIFMSTQCSVASTNIFEFRHYYHGLYPVSCITNRWRKKILFFDHNHVSYNRNIPKWNINRNSISVFLFLIDLKSKSLWYNILYPSNMSYYICVRFFSFVGKIYIKMVT